MGKRSQASACVDRAGKCSRYLRGQNFPPTAFGQTSMSNIPAQRNTFPERNSHQKGGRLLELCRTFSERFPRLRAGGLELRSPAKFRAPGSGFRGFPLPKISSPSRLPQTFPVYEANPELAAELLCFLPAVGSSSKTSGQCKQQSHR